MFYPALSLSLSASRTVKRSQALSLVYEAGVQACSHLIVLDLPQHNACQVSSFDDCTVVDSMAASLMLNEAGLSHDVMRPRRYELIIPAPGQTAGSQLSTKIIQLIEDSKKKKISNLTTNHS